MPASPQECKLRPTPPVNCHCQQCGSPCHIDLYSHRVPQLWVAAHPVQQLQSSLLAPTSWVSYTGERRIHILWLGLRISTESQAGRILRNSEERVLRPEDEAGQYVHVCYGRRTLRWKCLTMAAAMDLDLISVQLQRGTATCHSAAGVSGTAAPRRNPHPQRCHLHSSFRCIPHCAVSCELVRLHSLRVRRPRTPRWATNPHDF